MAFIAEFKAPSDRELQIRSVMGNENRSFDREGEGDLVANELFYPILETLALGFLMKTYPDFVRNDERAGFVDEAVLQKNRTFTD